MLLLLLLLEKTTTITITYKSTIATQQRICFTQNRSRSTATQGQNPWSAEIVPKKTLHHTRPHLLEHTITLRHSSPRCIIAIHHCSSPPPRITTTYHHHYFPSSIPPHLSTSPSRIPTNPWHRASPPLLITTNTNHHHYSSDHYSSPPILDTTHHHHYSSPPPIHHASHHLSASRITTTHDLSPPLITTAPHGGTCQASASNIEVAGGRWWCNQS